MSDSEIRLVNFKASNFKRIVAVDFAVDPETSEIVVSGDNAQGKSSILDGFWAAITGAKGAVESPIRHGEFKAVVEVNLGQFVITKEWEDGKKPKLTVVKDGVKKSGGQTLLNELFALISIDPVEFLSMKPADQLDTVRKVAGVDFTKVDEEAADAFSERTDVKRDLNKMKGSYETLPQSDESLGTEVVNVLLLTQELTQAQEHNRAYESVEQNMLDIDQKIEEHRDAIHELSKKLKIGEEFLNDESNALINVSKLKEEVEDCERHNEHRRNNVRRIAMRQEIGSLDDKVKQLNETIENCKVRKTVMAGEASLPIKGLDFTGETLLFNNVSFKDASSADRIKIAAKIGMVTSPDLKVMTVKDGSLLDPGSREALREIAEEHNFQVIIETVSAEEGSIVIEDGSIVSEAIAV